MMRRAILFMSLILLIVGVVFAPDMDRDRVQDREQIRDPTSHIGDEPIQDRDRVQDRDRLVDSSLVIGDSNLITRDNLRDRQILITNENPIRDRDQIRDSTTHAGDEPIQDRDRIGNSRITVLNNDVGESTSLNIQIMENLATNYYMGEDANRFNLVLNEVKNSYQNTIEAENNLMERSRFKRMFMGEDREEIERMRRELILNRERLRELKQISQDCDCEPQVRLLLQEQIRNMEQEQEGLENTANSYQNRRGLFGFLIK